MITFTLLFILAISIFMFITGAALDIVPLSLVGGVGIGGCVIMLPFGLFLDWAGRAATW